MLEVGERDRDERAADAGTPTAQPRSTTWSGAGDGRCQIGSRPAPVAHHVDRVARERAEHRGEQCLVVLQPAAVQHLEREDRGAERRAEQDREPGGHPRDRQHARRRGPRASSRVRGPRREGARGLHQRGLGTHAPPPDAMHSNDVGISDRSMRTPVGRARDVDVVDHELDVAR